VYLKGADSMDVSGLGISQFSSPIHDWAWETVLSLCRAWLIVLSIESLSMSGCG